MVQKQQQTLINVITTKEAFREFILSCLNDKETKPNIATDYSNQGDDELLTVSQLAIYFQVSSTTIHNWKNEGILPYVKVKSRVRFRKSVILAFDKKRRSKSKY